MVGGKRPKREAIRVAAVSKKTHARCYATPSIKTYTGGLAARMLSKATSAGSRKERSATT